MQAQIVAPPVSLQQVIDRILSSRRITRLDQSLLMALGCVNAEEQRLINQVFDSLRKGLLRVAD